MIVEPRVEDWMQGQLAQDDPVEAKMRRVGEEAGFPIIGPLVGRYVEMMARSIGARRVFEMGSGFGYSTLFFARAVEDGGEVVHTDGDPENTEAAMRWLDEAGLAKRVRFVTGDALEALRSEQGTFDIVFIDIDKGDYPAAWRLARDKVRVGGLVITDNTLWSGKVADPDDDEAWTQAVREYVALTAGDPAFLTTIVPLRDGVAVSLRLE